MKFKISKIQARDLVNSGTLLDAQDPGLKIKIGKYEFATERWLFINMIDVTRIEFYKSFL